MFFENYQIMKEYAVKILGTKQLTHDVRQFRLEKPEAYSYVPGQATKVSVNKEGWKDEARPFTFTSLPDEDELEFVIKIYESHGGVTNEINKLGKGDEFILREPWGSINFKGKGVFIAGGAGITPFIAILRHLEKKNKLEGNKLIFANNTVKDIILENELREMLGKDNFINVLVEEAKGDYHQGYVSKELLEEHVPDFGNMFYVCGPPPMMKAVLSDLKELEVDDKQIVREVF